MNTTLLTYNLILATQNKDYETVTNTINCFTPTERDNVFLELLKVAAAGIDYYEKVEG